MLASLSTSALHVATQKSYLIKISEKEAFWHPAKFVKINSGKLQVWFGDNFNLHIINTRLIQARHLVRGKLLTY